MKIYQIDKHIQSVREDGRITCDCMWMTMEMGRKKNWRHWRYCKHINKLIKIIENEKPNTRRKRN